MHTSKDGHIKYTNGRNVMHKMYGLTRSTGGHIECTKCRKGQAKNREARNVMHKTYERTKPSGGQM